jgi:hypothetical protein
VIEVTYTAAPLALTGRGVGVAADPSGLTGRAVLVAAEPSAFTGREVFTAPSPLMGGAWANLAFKRATIPRL